jgi:glutathione S-transferase
MRRLTHFLLSPPSRFARLLIGEKRLACDLAVPDEGMSHLPIFTDLDGTSAQGLWAIVDHLEGTYGDQPLIPEDPVPRAETLRLLDWSMGPLLDAVVRRIVYEKASPRYTGASTQRTPDMLVIRAGREALRPVLAEIGASAERKGYLACRECSLGDLAVAANLSALDYFGEVPWADFSTAAEWYVRLKSRPSFRPLLSDRIPGQPPVMHYAELDG